MHTIHSGKLIPDNRVHIRIKMHRINNFDVVKPFNYGLEGPADRAQRVAVVFAPVRGHQDDPPRIEVDLIQRRALERAVKRDRPESVDDRVAGDKYAFFGDSLTQQILFRALGWSEMHVGETTGNPPVYLFGKGLIAVKRTQSCFNVPTKTALY